jgi:hypothetical protein
VVLAVAIAGPADPAVLDGVRVQAPEGVHQAVLVVKGLVEVVLEGGEEPVVGLVVGFEDASWRSARAVDGLPMLKVSSARLLGLMGAPGSGAGAGCGR